MQIGTTFDIDEAQSHNIEPLKMLDDIRSLGIAPIRIGIKWNKVEKEKGKYRWDSYDEVFKFLDKHRIPSILAIGMKVPRWPEFHLPDWIVDEKKEKGIYGFRINFKDNLYRFIQKCIERYTRFSQVKWIQVENEPFLKAGPKKLSISKGLLNEELDLVSSLTRLPIMLTAQGLPNTGLFAEFIKGRYGYKRNLIDKSDILGLHVYEKFEGQLFGRDNHIFSATRLSWLYLKHLIKYARKNGKKVWITELQAEPWESTERDYTQSNIYRTCNPETVSQNIKRLRELGIKTILVWGTEFHLSCKKAGNSDWTNKIYLH